MAWDDYVYVALILVCIPLGAVVKHINGYTNRQLYCGLVGFILALLALQTQIWHSLLTIVVSYLILKFSSIRYCHVISLVFNFGYLAFFRMAAYFGYAEVSTGTPNALQLILSLKLISVAFDLRDSMLQSADSAPKDGDHDQKPHIFPPEARNLGVLEYFCYSYCFLGLFTGPFFRYTTFHDFLNQTDPEKLPTAKKALKELTYVPFYITVFLVLQKYFPVWYIVTDEYLNHTGGFLYRMAYLYPCLTWFRWRFYIAWQLAVCSFTMAGMGAYPKDCESRSGQGPSKISKKYKDNVLTVDSQTGFFIEEDIDFTTIQQLHVWPIETMTRATGAMQHWNMSVQYWMYSYVFKRFPIREYRRAAVFVASAYWHGLHIGYYFAFLMMLFCIVAQEGFVKVTQPLRNRSQSSVWLVYFWNFLDWNISWRIYDYDQAPFRLLEWNDTFKVWGSLYYVGHILSAIFIIPALTLPNTNRKDSNKNKKNE